MNVSGIVILIEEELDIGFVAVRDSCDSVARLPDVQSANKVLDEPEGHIPVVRLALHVRVANAAGVVDEKREVGDTIYKSYVDKI